MNPGVDHEAAYDRAYAELVTATDAIVATFCAKFVRTFGDTRFETADFIARHAVPSSRLYLVETLLSIAAERGLLRREGAGFRAVLDRPAPTASETVFIDSRDPTLVLASRCREGLEAHLTGRQSGVEVLFPKGDLDTWARVHRESPVMRHYAASCASLCAERLRPGARLLEIGAGTGSTTGQLLDACARAGAAEYVFSDVGRVLLAAARRRYGSSYPFTRFARIDINEPLAPQGLAPESFDLVLGTNVLHVANDLPRALGEIASVLRPGGSLVLGEGRPPEDGTHWRGDVIFGFLDGWRGFLSIEEWRAPMERAGFVIDRSVMTESFGLARCGGAIVARRP